VQEDANKRGRQRAAVLRRYRAGYRIETIARELRITREEVLQKLVDGGVSFGCLNNWLERERQRREFVEQLPGHVA
jgi:hypothetical protein